MPDVTDDPDDLPGVLSRNHYQSLSKRLFIWENGAGKTFTDDDDFGALLHFLFGEVPAAQQRNTECAEVLPVHTTPVRTKGIVNCNRRTARNGERHVIALAAERKLRNEANVFHTWQTTDATFKLGEKVGGTIGSRILLSREINTHGQDVARIETRIGFFQLNKTSDEQSGAD